MESPSTRWSLLAAACALAAVARAGEPVTPLDPKDIAPLKIHRTVEPIFPPVLSQRMIDEGEARVLVMVDRHGRLADWIVTGYTDAHFAKEALEVLPKWKFEPATYQGRPIDARAEDLDRIPEIVAEISPMPPDQLGAVATSGRVVVDYYIDPQGRVRMPIVLESDDEAFTNSVLLAMSDWRYEPPTRGGVPVMTRLWREFQFRPVGATQN